MSATGSHESTAAWHDLLDTLGSLDRPSWRAIARSPTTGTSPTATACSRPRWASRSTPTCSPTRAARVWVELNSPLRPDRRWGGDNTDAYYFMCPVDPKRRYRISGNRGDSVYFSVTAYNEPSPGRMVRQDRGDRARRRPRNRRERQLLVRVGAAPDAVVLMTRDYQADPATGRPVSWQIEALDEPDAVPPRRHRDRGGTARKHRVAAHDVRHRAAGGRSAGRGRARARHEISQAANEFADPYQVPDANFGWSARDACYAYGSFVLEDDEALVVTHRPPACRFWNLVVWNQFMATPGVSDARSSSTATARCPMPTAR